jgi:peptide/nickel transport system substrate-binding protein
MRGELDMILSEAYVVPPERSGELKAAGIEIKSRPSSTWEHLDFSFYYGPFKERAVREAMILAINRQRLVQTAYRGSGKVANGVVPSSNADSLDRDDFAQRYPEVAARYKLPIYPYDPVRAARLLEEAGWKLDPDGIRSKNGVKLKFIYGTTINSVRQQIQAQVSTDLRAIGIATDLRAWPAVCFHCPLPRLLPFGDVALVEFAWVNRGGADFDVWTCAEIYDRRTNSGQNEQQYCNPALDAANRRFKTEIGLEAQLASAEAQVILMQDIAVIPLVERANVELVSTNLQNHKLTNGVNINSSFWNARQWYFK